MNEQFVSPTQRERRALNTAADAVRAKVAAMVISRALIERLPDFESLINNLYQHVQVAFVPTLLHLEEEYTRAWEKHYAEKRARRPRIVKAAAWVAERVIRRGAPEIPPFGWEKPVAIREENAYRHDALYSADDVHALLEKTPLWPMIDILLTVNGLLGKDHVRFAAEGCSGFVVMARPDTMAMDDAARMALRVRVMEFYSALLHDMAIGKYMTADQNDMPPAYRDCRRDVLGLYRIDLKNVPRRPYEQRITDEARAANEAAMQKVYAAFAEKGIHFVSESDLRAEGLSLHDMAGNWREEYLRTRGLDVSQLDHRPAEENADDAPAPQGPRLTEAGQRRARALRGNGNDHG